MINGRTNPIGADVVNLSDLLFQGKKLRHSDRCRGKKRQFTKVGEAEGKEFRNQLPAKTGTTLRSFRGGRLRCVTGGLRTKPNDRRKSLEDTRTNLKNKPSGMENALVCSEIMTLHRITSGSEQKRLCSTPILFFIRAKPA
jgi:hypothetical protein